MKRNWVFCLCALAAACAADNAVEATPAVTGKAEAALEDLAGSGFVGSVLVACNDRVIFEGDYGFDVAPAQPPRYWVASVAKAVTAISIMSLTESGELGLDDKISKFFPDAPADKSDITVFQLLTHQSGLPQEYKAEGFEYRDAAAASIFQSQLLFPPGADFSYANDNYSLLAMIIEIVSAKPYKFVVDEAVSEPLGLAPVAFWPDPVLPGEIVPPLLYPLDPAKGRIDWGFLGGHGARLSVVQLHSIVDGLVSGKLVTPESVQTLLGPHLELASGLGVGMGFYAETDAAGRRLRFTRGYDSSGGNAIAYLVGENGLEIIAATNAGPDEDAGPGWSRVVRDALIPIFAPAGGEDVCVGAS
jgi:CubicO group peptidase (beta-lactamase class C family)